MNRKENYYIYHFKQLNKLIGQRSIKENDKQNNMFDIVTRPQEHHREQGYKYATQLTTKQWHKTQEDKPQ
jgi:hypothetical protein